MAVKYIILSSVWTLIILILTLIPGPSIPSVPIFGVDKIVHAFIFGILMFLVCNVPTKALSELNSFLIISFSICILYGITIEIIQQYIPGRSFSIYDIIANSIGVFLGYTAFKIKAKK